MADNLASLTRFDLVRVSKLIQQIQSTLVVFILAFFLGSLIDKLFPTVGDPAQISNFTLFKDLALQLALMTIAAFYIMKFAKVVPFFFALSRDYIPNAHNEAAEGAALALAVIFGGIQRNLQARIGVLKARFYPN